MLGRFDGVYDKLQDAADIAILDTSIASEFTRPILNRLRDFVAVAISSLKLYPNSIVLHHLTADRIEVRVIGLSTAIVVFAPVEQLVPEIYLNKMAATKHLPMPHMLKHDVSFNELPIAYAVYSFIAGVPLQTVTDETMQRVAAKHVGRTIRSLHLINAHGLGAPQVSGKWANRSWHAVIQQWLTDRGYYERLLELLGPRLLGQFLDYTTKHPSLQQFEPSVLFGGVARESIMVLVHGNIQVEGMMRSGRIVAGDAMFDVASGMRASLGIGFRQGFVDGYTMHAPMTSAEVARVKRYALLWRTIDTAMQISTQHDKDAFIHSVTHVLAEALIAPD
ncbi:MAG: phosphotransferase [Roseiflexaceae bacterium]